MLSINVLLQPHVFNSSFYFLSLVRAKKKGKNFIPIFIQKLRVRVIYECVLYSNKYDRFSLHLLKKLLADHLCWICISMLPLSNFFFCYCFICANFIATFVPTCYYHAFRITAGMFLFCCNCLLFCKCSKSVLLAIYLWTSPVDALAVVVRIA